MGLFMKNKEGNLFTLEENLNATYQVIKGNSEDYDMWHKRLGHANPTIIHILKASRFNNFPNWTKKSTICVSSQLGTNCKNRLTCLIKFHIFLFTKYIVIYEALAPIYS